MNLNEVKDKIAQDNGFKDWETAQSQLFDGDLIMLYEDVPALYAQEKVKQALELAAEEVSLKDDWEEYTFTDYIDRDSILSLLPELLENLKKEI